MRALLDADLIDQKQLLDLVNTERRRFVDDANRLDETYAA